MENQNNQSNKKIYIIVWIIVLIILAFLAWHLFFQKQSVGQNTQNTTEQQSTTTQANDSGVNAEIPPGAITLIQPKPQKVNVPEPSLDRSTVASTIDPAVVTNINAKMDVTVANLKKDPTSFQDWIDLGFERKTLNDYAGAATDWEYDSLLYPQNLISFGDLGDLYANFLKDTVKAEVAYKTAITNDPTNAGFYVDLATLYISEGKASQAVSLLKIGIAKNPSNFELAVDLARYYRGIGDKTSAKTYYDQAVAVAKKTASQSVVNAISTEENSM